VTSGTFINFSITKRSPNLQLTYSRLLITHWITSYSWAWPVQITKSRQHQVKATLRITGMVEAQFLYLPGIRKEATGDLDEVGTVLQFVKSGGAA